MKVSLVRPVFDEEVKSAALGALQSERFVMGERFWRYWRKLFACSFLKFTEGLEKGFACGFHTHIIFWLSRLLKLIRHE